ncbi:hypothetical protein Kyoto59B_10000 [Helicobacter pylori]
MAEWKTDTEGVKQIVKKCRDFKGSLQEGKCAQFIKKLDGYAQEILLECRKIERKLEEDIEELRKAKSNERGARFVLRSLQVGSFLSSIWPPARIAAMAAIAAAEMVLKFMGMWSYYSKRLKSTLFKPKRARNLWRELGRALKRY